MGEIDELLWPDPASHHFRTVVEQSATNAHSFLSTGAHLAFVMLICSIPGPKTSNHRQTFWSRFAPEPIHRFEEIKIPLLAARHAVGLRLEARRSRIHGTMVTKHQNVNPLGPGSIPSPT
jgi:hypothetical protein